MAEGGKPYGGATSFEFAGGRLRFTVELRPGETTIVSWKKLLKEVKSGKPKPGPSASGPSQIRPVSEGPLPSHSAAVAPSSLKRPVENEQKDLQAQAGPNRLSNVIERIERMYAGNGSSDEEDVVLDNVPDDDEYDTEDSFIDDAELDDYFQVDNSSIKHDGFFVNRGKLERIEPTISTNQQPKKRRRKDLTKVHGGNDDGRNPNKTPKIGNAGKKASSLVERNSTSESPRVAMPTVHGEDTKRQDTSNGQQRPGVLSSEKQVSESKESELQDTSARRSNNNSSHVSKSHSGKHINNGDGPDQLVQQKEVTGHVERFDLNDVSSPSTKDAVMQRKEGSSVRPKSTTLEKAIRELEKTVAEFRPPSTEVQDPDNSSQAVKRRLPTEIKQKLGKVAKIVQTSYGYDKIPKDVINRLMSIVGHLMQIRTLKRNLKVMSNTGLSAKQEKDNQIQKRKEEVAEMVKQRIPQMKSKVEQLAANSDDFQEAGPQEKKALKRKYIMDDVLEDKICDLYDIYVEGQKEDSSAPLRRLYEELAVSFPSGIMDVDGIKCAIFRAKQRRKKCSVLKDQDKIKRKKASASKAEDTHEKLLSDSRRHASKPVSNSARAHFSVANCSNMDKPKKTKVKGSSSSNPVDDVALNVLLKKKVKRKPNPEAVEGQSCPEKAVATQAEERPKQRQKQHKNMGVSLTKSNHQVVPFRL